MSDLTPTPSAMDLLAIAPSEMLALAAPPERGVARGLLDGVQIGPWRLEALLGAGGMGEVYRAVHTVTGQTAAVKLLRSAPWLAGGTGLARFRREARVAGAIDHPHVVPVLDLGEERGTWWMAMALVEGASLQRWVEQNGPLPWRLALRAVAQAACGLQAAHDNCIVHRDVKPANIVLGRDGRAQVADFGIAAGPDTAGELTLTGQVVGTPAFMSPEQCTGALADGRSDLYALGATLFFCVTGHPPFSAPADGGPLALLEAQVRTPAPRADRHNPEVPEALARCIDKLLQKSPAARYQTAAAFVADAVAVLAGGEPALAGGDDTSVRYSRVFAEGDGADGEIDACLAAQAAARERGERPAPLGELLARRGAVAFAPRAAQVAGRTTVTLTCPACGDAAAATGMAWPVPVCASCGGGLQTDADLEVGEAWGRLVCVPRGDARDLGDAVLPVIAAGLAAGYLHAAVDCSALGRLAEHATIWITDALEMLLAEGGSLALVVPETRTRAFLAAVGVDQYVRVVESRAALVTATPQDDPRPAPPVSDRTVAGASQTPTPTPTP